MSNFFNDKKRNLYKEIYNLFGNVKRARGYFLYTEKGVRLTDLFLEDGRAILGWGHEGTGAFRIFKNVIERGVTGSFQTCFENQMHKAVCELLGERQLFIFDDKKKALSAAQKINSEEPFFYFPWRDANSNFQEKSCIIFEPTLPWTSGIFILAVKLTVVIDENVISSFPEQLFVAPPMQAAVARSVYDLIKQLQVREEKNWFVYDTVLTKYWIRKGPWLYPKIPQEKYDDFVRHCLDCGLVINPDFFKPSIVPFGIDKGNFTKLKNNPFDF